MPAPPEPPVTLSLEEARELYAYMLHDYINPNTQTALLALLDRVGRFVQQVHQ